MPTKLLVSFVTMLIFKYACYADENAALDRYTCVEFLGDAKQPGDGSKLIRSLMMVSWATGYIAAHQKGATRADAHAIELTAAALGDACRNRPTQLVVNAIVDVVNKVVEETKVENTTLRLPDPIVVGMFDTYDTYDMNGGDSRQIKDLELKKCVAACASDSNCKGYSYDKWNHWCFLKNKITPLLREPSSTVGVKHGQPKVVSESSTTIDLLRHKAFLGVPFQTKQVDEVHSCQASCDSESRCLAFSFVTLTRQCEMFSEPRSVRPATDVTSGIKHQLK